MFVFSWGGFLLIDNIVAVDELRTLARARGKDFSQKSIPSKALEAALDEGWLIQRKSKTSVQIRRAKAHDERFRDKVWSLLYKMDMLYITGHQVSSIVDDEISTLNPHGVVCAIDQEISLFINVISLDSYSKCSLLHEIMQEMVASRERLIKAVSKRWPVEQKRNTVLALFLNNVLVSDEDKEKAKTLNISLFDEQDLDYYEKLVSHIGPAAKYQFFADMLPGKSIPGLTIRVPAVKTKMGKQVCYTFPISPEYLLKISYVSHRSKGKASDVHTYQRMLAKGRLGKIREYISEQGVFPTNIVVNIDKKYANFEKIKQETGKEESEASGVLGWLSLRPAYKSAWIIDGQHRLYAYSGHEYAKTGHLSVLAFEGISPSSQAKLFVDINAKQKSVKPSLLQELFAELHWDAESPSTRVQAVISKAIQTLGADKDSPFLGRIQSADSTKDSSRCISLASLYRAIDKQSFYIYKEEKNFVVDPGPFWAGTNEKTLSRSVSIIKVWFGAIRQNSSEWWDLGSADGGGLAMNDSVTACLMLLKSVLNHIELSGRKLSKLDVSEVNSLIKPYAEALGHYFASLNAEERKLYRDLRGMQGQSARNRRGQQALKNVFPEFSPPGLEDYLSREKEQTNLHAKLVIDRIEILIKNLVVQELFQEFGEEWWGEGVPKAMRIAISTRSENDDNKRGLKEAYFDLLDYRVIALNNWSIFQSLLGQGKKNDNKDKQTKWLVEVNEMRNAVAHASSGVSLSVEKLSALKQHEAWLKSKIKSDGSNEEEEALAFEED
ncbi:DGQHR domain-containing protein [Pseudomonas yamanorum]|jgi:DNA sulfur modification protein DndB|uniref:DGQHR domain-containing protein n=1 Tax=Pseudomonas yamanorum TaxID=515393 RepID=UPI00087C3D52|nr:DGQHR domain-containing protein [Pseudomonas yamanorum]SDU39172.1 DGQHR domain-containing protein [Pseudomonas yamanorum]